MNNLLEQYEEEKKHLESLLSFYKKDYLQERKEKENEIVKSIKQLKDKKKDLEFKLQQLEPKQNTKKYEAVDPLLNLLDNFRKDITHSYVFFEHFRWKSSLKKWKHDYINVQKAMHVFPQYPLQVFDQIFKDDVFLCEETSSCLLNEINKLEEYLKKYKNNFVVYKDDQLQKLKSEKRKIQKNIQKQQNIYIKLDQTFSSKRLKYIQFKELYNQFKKIYTILLESTYISNKN